MIELRRTATRHWVALSAGVACLIAMFALPPGIIGYLASAGIALVAVLIGHGAARHRGPRQWAAIVGLVLSYLALITSVGYLLIRLTRLAG